MIGNLDGTIYFDPYWQNFDDYMTGFNILYVMISFDGFPMCMFPAYGIIKNHKIYI